MRYAYAITSALLLGGATATIALQPGNAQTAQNEPGTIQAVAPKPGAPMSFADMVAKLQPAVVNISTKQTIVQRQQANPFAGTPLGDLFGGMNGGTQGGAPGEARRCFARLRLPDLARRLCRHQQPRDLAGRAGRDGGLDHGDTERQEGICRQGHRQGPGFRSCAAEDRRGQSAVRQIRRLQRCTGRRLGGGDRRAIRARRDCDRGYRLGDQPRHRPRRRL